MSLRRILLFTVNRILFNVKRILLFDVNLILLFDLNRILQWRVPPMLLAGLGGWFLAPVALQMTGMSRGGLAVLGAALSAGAVALSDLVRRIRAEP